MLFYEIFNKKILFFFVILNIFFSPLNAEEDTNAILEKLKQDVKTLEKAVYSDSENISNTSLILSNNDEDVLTRHLLKLSEIEQQFQQLTNRFEEINFKIDKLSSRLSKIQADNQLRFQELEIGNDNNIITSNNQKSLPGSSQPQDLGSVSFKDTETQDLVQKTQSIETTSSVVTENFVTEEKILPKTDPKQQYNFATALLKQGDYTTAERALREFVIDNPEHTLAGNAQYWYAETFRIRQLYTDAASAYLEGYQKYPKSEKAAINLLKLGVSLVQIGEKDQVA
ncbi:MAG: tol-pal system protein YbgF [Candidatus Pelagibacter sp.]